jgi:hypothetical protein
VVLAAPEHRELRKIVEDDPLTSPDLAQVLGPLMQAPVRTVALNRAIPAHRSSSSAPRRGKREGPAGALAMRRAVAA